MGKEIIMTDAEKQKVLSQLALAAIARLKVLPQPVVRICGPLTSGGYGYEENKRIFLLATAVLKEKGYTVFDYFDGNSDEDYIATLGLPWEEVMEYYHKPILESGLITTAFFLPGWRESNGATWEHNFISAVPSMRVEYFQAEWLKR